MVRVVAIVVAMVFAAANIHGYRFICNGILADGQERVDSCGLCDEAHAARWENPNIPISVSDSPLPFGISLLDWRSAVASSFRAWEDVSGSDLRFVEIAAHSQRDFGANESLHEIFWITDKTEWRKLVGAGEFGTLGATLPRYTCGGDQGAKRVIFDADLVLNGMDHITWQMDCDSDDCISVQTTLVHELGHFFGLDHPCLFCSTSIMSARAGFDLKYPMFDDMEGARVLYPSTNGGGFGYPCLGSTSCNRDLFCVDDGLNHYCSRTCDSDQECEMGATCVHRGTDKVCAFMSGDDVRPKDIGENCSRTSCRDPLICAGAVTGDYYCFAPCFSRTDCQLQQACVQVEETGICLTLKSIGETCRMTELCERDLFCHMEDNKTAGICRSGCRLSLSDYEQCQEGESCRIIESGQALCLPSAELFLGESSDSFGNPKNEDRFGRDKAPLGTPGGGGCSTAGAHNSGLWVMCLVMLLWVSRTRFCK